MRLSKNQSQKRQIINCVNEDGGEGHNANNDAGNHHLVISGNGH